MPGLRAALRDLDKRRINPWSPVIGSDHTTAHNRWYGKVWWNSPAPQVCRRILRNRSRRFRGHTALPLQASLCPCDFLANNFGLDALALDCKQRERAGLQHLGTRRQRVDGNTTHGRTNVGSDRHLPGAEGGPCITTALGLAGNAYLHYRFTSLDQPPRICRRRCQSRLPFGQRRGRGSHARPRPTGVLGRLKVTGWRPQHRVSCRARIFRQCV